jgi:enoyl-CoA hydratase
MAVEVERHGAVAVVTIDRPEALNALNMATNQEIMRVAHELTHDEAVRAVVLTGGGEKSFVAGADVAEFRDMNAEQARQASWLGAKVCEAIEGARQPWIAAVNGFALGGGCELALACDIRLASEKAKFGQPEVNLGILPGFGGTQRLPRAVGLGWAKYLCLSGRHIRADEALRIGLVQAVYPADRLMPEALALATELAGKAPLALRYIKSATHYAMSADIVTGCEIERDLFALAFASDDRAEGMTAFLEKRAPRFTGK